jgi:hypothetical protein
MTLSIRISATRQPARGRLAYQGISNHRSIFYGSPLWCHVSLAHGLHAQPVNPTLDVNTPDGTFKAYVTRPAIVPAPAIVVVQEIFGVCHDNEGRHIPVVDFAGLHLEVRIAASSPKPPGAWAEAAGTARILRAG